MLVFLLLVLLLWYSCRGTDNSAIRPPGLKARTEFHTPVMQQADPAAGRHTISFVRAAGELEARSRLERLGTAYEAGLISAEEYHREGSILLSATDFDDVTGPETRG